MPFSDSSLFRRYVPKARGAVVRNSSAGLRRRHDPDRASRDLALRSGSVYTPAKFRALVSGLGHVIGNVSEFFYFVRPAVTGRGVTATAVLKPLDVADYVAPGL